jgi:hypothetical protein
MKLVFWNMRGWGQPDRRHLWEFDCRDKVDVLGVQETLKEDFF